ncbi:MAG: hypothetical protein ACPGJV_13070 [Bacteriovoracaceae bacterium]
MLKDTPCQRTMCEVILDSNESTDFFCPKFNYGLDVYFIQSKKLKWLSFSRKILLDFCQRYPEQAYKREFEVHKDFFNGRRKHEIKKVAKKTGLIELYPNSKHPKWISFKNESRFLKNALKRNKSLSITQKAFTYSIAKEFKFQKNIPVSIEEWSKRSWDLITQFTTEGMGQEKLSTLLNTNRLVVNQKLKHFTIDLEIENQFVKVGKRLHESKYNKEQIKQFFKAHNLNGYKIDHKGDLYRQIPNKYKIKDFDLTFDFEEKGTFYYQNKRFNKIHSKKLDLSIPINKFIIIKRDALRRKLKVVRNNKFNNRLKKKIGVGPNGILNAKSISEMIYRNGKIHFFYQKIHKEIETVRKIGIELISNIDKKNISLKNPTKIYKDKSFMSLTEEQFNNLIKYYKVEFSDLALGERRVYRKKKREQRLSLHFSGGW